MKFFAAFSSSRAYRILYMYYTKVRRSEMLNPVSAGTEKKKKRERKKERKRGRNRNSSQTKKKHMLASRSEQ